MATRSKIISQAVQRSLIVPVSLDGSSEVFGAVIDTIGYDSLSLGIFLGTLSGSGTHSIVVKAYENAANSTSGGTDITTSLIYLPTPDANPITAAAGKFRAYLSMSGRQRYIYVSLTPTFGGSETAALVAGTCELGDIQTSEPVSS